MIKKLKVNVDVDDTLFNLTAGNLKIVREEYGHEVTPAMVKTWDFYSVNFPLVLDLWSDWTRYSQCEFFEGDIDFIVALRQEYDVRLVTASYPEIEVQKDVFLKERYGDIDIFHTREKHLVTVDGILIDDAIHNIESHITHNSLPGIMIDRSYGWNQGFEHPLVERVSSFDECTIAIEKIQYQYCK